VPLWCFRSFVDSVDLRGFSSFSFEGSWVSALCLFVDDLDPSKTEKPPRFDGLWVEFFVLG
jgi:hypothetical protein